MKNVNAIITLGGNNAVLMTESSYKKQGYKAFSASSSFIAGLQALNFILDKVSDNSTIDEKISMIHVPDILKGFAGHSFREYIRTNKTSSGREFTEEEKQLILSVVTKMMNKGLNCEIRESKFFPKELKTMKDLAIKVAKETKVQVPQQTASQTQPQEKSPVLVALEEQMAKAISEANFDLYDKLEERYNKILGAQPQVQSVVNEEPEEEYDEVELPEDLVNVDNDIANMDC